MNVETLGKNIKKAIDCSGISVSELARQMGKPRQTIQQFYGGKHAPTLLNAIMLADILGMSLDEMAGRIRGQQ